MTSGSSDVTMTAFEPVLAPCSACKSKRVSGSSCVDCSIYLYRYSSPSPTKNLMRLVLLKELHMNCLHCCMLCTLQAFVLKGCVKGNINPTTLNTHIYYHGQDRLCQLCKCCVVAVHPLYQTHTINDAG